MDASATGTGAGGPPPRFVPPRDPRPDDVAWPTMLWPPPADLAPRNEWVALSPVDPDGDAPTLFEALDDDRVWAHLSGRPRDAGELARTLHERQAMGWYQWLVREARTGRVVGTSAYLEVSPPDARLEIGSTGYCPDVWASMVNPATKLLLLGLAFETLQAGRVQLKTDVRNVRSQQAIARLGATYEGVLRRYQRRADGTVRDTVLFSVTAEQWPVVRDGLRARLAPGDRDR